MLAECCAQPQAGRAASAELRGSRKLGALHPQRWCMPWQGHEEQGAPMYTGGAPAARKSASSDGGV